MKLNLILISLILTFLTGCSTIIKYRNIDVPRQNIYEVPEDKKYDFGLIAVKEDTACPERWTTCIPRDEFNSLVVYMLESKAVIEKYTQQAELLNKAMDTIKENEKTGVKLNFK